MTIFLIGMCFTFGAMSYFGVLNPHPSGMVSSLLVASVSLAILTLARFLSRFYFASLLGVMWLFSAIATIGNWWYFQYFQSYFNYRALALLSESTDSLKSLDAFEKGSEALTLIVITAVLGLLSVIFYRRLEVKDKGGWVMLSFWLSIVMVTASILNTSFERYREMSVFSLAPSYLSPIHAFFVNPERSFGEYQAEQLASLEEKYASFNSVVEFSDGRDFAKDYNVIIIVLESIRASLIGYYSDGESLTPNLDAFARVNVVANQFYANTNFTVKGETAIWCGIFDYNAKPPYSNYSDSIQSLTCLPGMLAERGYSTIYYHGNGGDFYNRESYLPLVGFTRSVYLDKSRALDLGMPIMGWGASDESMYEYMLRDLESQSGAFFAHFTTISSHYPFKWEWGISMPEHVLDYPKPGMYGDYRRAAYYEDYAFGKFWENFSSSRLYNNTIVIVTADHGIWSFDEAENNSLLMMNEKFFRMPLMIYHPDVDIAMQIDQVSSQMDIAPTILAMLGMHEEKQQFVGKNMLQPVAKPWAAMMKSGEVSIRLGNTLCSMARVACAGPHQECMAKSYGEILLREISSLQSCVEIEGDLLLGGSSAPTRQENDLIGDALGLIQLQNYRVFN